MGIQFVRAGEGFSVGTLLRPEQLGPKRVMRSLLVRGTLNNYRN